MSSRTADKIAVRQGLAQTLIERHQSTDVQQYSGTSFEKFVVS
jgi:hypothetical protein